MLPGNFAELTTSTPFRDLLHAGNLRHVTDGFTSPPKEDVLRTFSPLKIRRLRPGLNPRTCVLKASTLPLDHRTLYHVIYSVRYYPRLHVTTVGLTTYYPWIRGSTCIYCHNVCYRNTFLAIRIITKISLIIRYTLIRH